MKDEKINQEAIEEETEIALSMVCYSEKYCLSMEE
jgi:hypothetical protein